MNKPPKPRLYITHARSYDLRLMDASHVGGADWDEHKFIWTKKTMRGLKSYTVDQVAAIHATDQHRRGAIDGRTKWTPLTRVYLDKHAPENKPLTPPWVHPYRLAVTPRVTPTLQVSKVPSFPINRIFPTG